MDMLKLVYEVLFISTTRNANFKEKNCKKWKGIATTVILKRFAWQKAGQRKNEITKVVCLQEKKRALYQTACKTKMWWRVTVL